MNKSLLNPLDLSTEETLKLLEFAKDIKENPKKYNNRCSGKILATLFFEPSTRTRFSFESAMLRLGGSILGFSEPNSSSTSKGETLADTIKMVSIYSDIIAMRHPIEGSAKVADMYSEVPVINAGDGAHQHPTQTLTDLSTIYSLKGRLDNHTVGICGDLKNGRTVSSLIMALSRYEKVRFILISPEQLRIPKYIRNYLITNSVEFEEVNDLEQEIPKLDILYMTRVQQERFDDKEEYERLKDSYILTREKLNTAKKDMIVMHPLPRVNEIAVDVDSDSRAVYFKQAEYGMYVRMALIIALLEAEKSEVAMDVDCNSTEKYICHNEKCITKVEKYLPSDFTGIGNGQKKCNYCDSIR